jgi:hypothetical protein
MKTDAISGVYYPRFALACCLDWAWSAETVPDVEEEERKLHSYAMELDALRHTMHGIPSIYD